MAHLPLQRLSLIVVVLFVGILSLAVGQAGQAAAPGVIPEPFPFSDRYPAEVTLASPEDVAVLIEHRIDVGDVRLASGGYTLPGAGEPFEPLVAEVYVNDAEVDLLAQHGLAAQPIPNESVRAQRLYGPGNGAPDAWPSFAQFVARMEALAAAHPDIVRLESIGQSVQGRDLWVLKITDNPDVDEDEPEFKYSSSHHGDETVGIEITLRLAELLANNYGTDPALTELVDEMEIWLWPIFNPDGYVAGSRYNAHGVDLNRSFPDRIDDPIENPDGREPETRAAMYWGYDHRFVMGANYHGGAAVVNVPWDSVGSGFSYYAPDDDAFLEYGVGYSSRNSRIWNGGWTNGITRGWEWYIVYGGMQDWAYHWQGEHHVTIELGNTKKPPYEQMDTYWAENQAAMIWWMQRALRGARGLVTDAATGAPLDATVDVAEIGKLVRTDPDVGDYHRLLLPGAYTLVASAACYETQSAPVTVVDGPATVQDFQLVLSAVQPWTVQGTVTDQNTGEPLSATVEFEGRPYVAHTDPATGFYATDVCTGTYTMTVSAAGYLPAQRQVTVAGHRTEDFALQQAVFAVSAAGSQAAGGPGETVTHTFTITNLGTLEDSYTVSLVQGDWPATLLDTTVGPLEPLATGQARVAVYIPVQPGEGRQTIIATDVLTIQVTSATTPEVAAEAQGTTSMGVDLGVELVTDAAGRAARAGQVVTYTLTITNSGGYTDTYSLSGAGNLWPVELGALQTAPLGPGAAAEVMVRVEIPDGLPGVSDSVTVRAASEWDEDVFAEQALVTRRVWGVYLPLTIK